MRTNFPMKFMNGKNIFCAFVIYQKLFESFGGRNLLKILALIPRSANCYYSSGKNRVERLARTEKKFTLLPPMFALVCTRRSLFIKMLSVAERSSCHMHGCVTSVFKQKLIGMQMNCECTWQVPRNKF